ncbi:hypothetical protein PENTCL1PPCAC_21174, partial [Pristionchus entomophagus]
RVLLSQVLSVSESMITGKEKQARSLSNIFQFPNTEIPKLLKDFTIHEQIGQGHFHISVVHRATYKGKEVAVRMGKLYKDSYINAAELNNLFKYATIIDHQNVVKMFAYALHELDVNGNKYITHASVLELMTVSTKEIWQVAATNIIDEENLEIFLYSNILRNLSRVFLYMDEVHSQIAVEPLLSSILINPRGQIKISLSKVRFEPASRDDSPQIEPPERTLKLFELIYAQRPPTYIPKDMISIRVLPPGAPEYTRCIHERILDCDKCDLKEQLDDGQYVAITWDPDEESRIDEIDDPRVLEILEKVKPHLSSLRRFENIP